MNGTQGLSANGMFQLRSSTLGLCAHEIAARYGCSSCYESLQKVPLEQFDAAVIATPAGTHISIARECVKAGLHLLAGEVFLSESPDRKELLEYPCKRDDWHRAQAEDFFEAVAGGRDP